MIVRTLVVAVLFLACGAGLAGCNAEDDPPEETGSPAPEDEEPPTDDPGDPPPDEEEPPEPSEPPECEDDDDCVPLPRAVCAPQADFLPVVRGAEDLRALLFASVRTRGRCEYCESGDAERLLNANLLDSTRLLLPADDGSMEVTVYASHPARDVRQAGFMLADPEGALSLHEEGIRVELLRRNRVVARGELGERDDDDEREGVTLYDVGDSLRQLVMVDARNERFDAIRLRVEAGRSSRTLDVYAACVDRYGW